MKLLALSAAIALSALPAAAQTGQSNATQQFVHKAAISDLYEVQSSKLALEKASNSQIKDFAKMMVDDHTKTSNDMKSMVQKMQGIKMPNALDADHQNKIGQLRSASRDQFDQRYRAQQIEGHQAAVKLFEDYSNSGDNAELKSWAQKTLPNLRKHLEQAQALPQAPAPAVGAAPSQPAPQAGQARQPGQRSAMLAAPAANQMLLSKLRGKRVEGANKENIGDINDVLVDRNGRVVAVIVGVGGFLGMGEKNVAVPFQSLQFVGEQQSTGSGTTGARDGAMQADRIVLRGMSKADLEAAPSFRADASGDRGTTGGQPAPRNPAGSPAPRQ